MGAGEGITIGREMEGYTIAANVLNMVKQLYFLLLYYFELTLPSFLYISPVFLTILYKEVGKVKQHQGEIIGKNINQISILILESLFITNKLILAKYIHITILATKLSSTKIAKHPGSICYWISKLSSYQSLRMVKKDFGFGEEFM